MAKFRIYVKEEYQCTVQASGEEAAIEEWVDGCGFDSIEQAADEYFCQPDEITSLCIEDYDDRFIEV